MSDTEASLAISRTDDGWTLAGEVDAHTSPSLAEALGAVGGDPLVLDVRDVPFMDSSGLRVLVDASTRARAAGGSLVLLHAGASLRRLIEITGLEDVIVLRP